MTRNRNVTTVCMACGGRGWFDKHYPHTTIEDLMPHGEHSYMCLSCYGSGQRNSSRRIAMILRRRGMQVDRNSIWRIYRTAAERTGALWDICKSCGKPYYTMIWHDANGFGLHVVRERPITKVL